jgi:hypothetical protein
VTSPSGQAPAADLPHRVSLASPLLVIIAGLTPAPAASMSVAAGAGIALLTAVVAGALAAEGRPGHDTVEA